MAKTMAEMPDCEPAPEHNGVEYHWLTRPFGDLMVALWSQQYGWWRIGEVHPKSGQDMTKAGFKYLAPCLPPDS